MMPPPSLTTVYTMPPLYFVPRKWPALAYLQTDGDVYLLVYHDGKQKRLWGDNEQWLKDRITAGDYRLTTIAPQLKGAQK